MAIAAATFTVLGVDGTAASALTLPTLTPTEASFPIPSRSIAIWTLNLWSHGHLLASTTATSGTLALEVPTLSNCALQADVRKNGVYYSGTARVFSSCGPSSTTTVASTTTTVQPTSTTRATTTSSTISTTSTALVPIGPSGGQAPGSPPTTAALLRAPTSPSPQTGTSLATAPASLAETGSAASLRSVAFAGLMLIELSLGMLLGRRIWLRRRAHFYR